VRFSKAGVALLLALVVSLAGCSDRIATSPARDASARPFHGCQQVRCEGRLDGGGTYRIRLPRIWNGTLLLYSQGYRDGSVPGRGGAVVASDDAVARQLLASGYALAGAAQPANGWTVNDGVNAAESLYAWFRAEVAVPTRVYTWGESGGGLVSELLAEQRTWVSGTAPMCAPLAGTNLNQDLALDVAFGVKALLYPGEQLTGYDSVKDASATYEEAVRRVRAAAGAGGEPLAKVLLIGALVNAPEQSAAEDGGTPGSRIAAVVQNVLDALAAGIVGRPELEWRAGGNPATNVDADYDRRVPDLKRAEIAQLSSATMAAVYAMLARIDGARRVPADAAAREAADRLAEPTGQLRVPTVTLHTTVDPLAVPQNERLFGDAVARASARTADLLQLFTRPPEHYSGRAPYGAGHCAFTTWEQVGTIISLDRWVKTGDQPTLQDLAVMLAGPERKTGFIPAYQPVPWPVRIAH
jgi:hypothetical protein